MLCERCGISSEKARLVDVISPERIIKLCENCARAEGFPVVKKPTTAQLLEAEKPAYYSRHYSLGSNTKETAKRIKDFGKPVPGMEEVSLKDIVDKNYKEKISGQGKGPRADLVDNFHWTIMRARRFRKLTQKELAREISEAEAAIMMAERGILPEDDYKLVKKLEAYLGIKLMKEEARKSLASQREPPARILKIDPDSMKNLTIDDLKRMKQARELGEDETETPTQNLPEENHDYQEGSEIPEEDSPEFDDEEF